MRRWPDCCYVGAMRKWAAPRSRGSSLFLVVRWGKRVPRVGDYLSAGPGCAQRTIRRSSTGDGRAVDATSASVAKASPARGRREIALRQCDRRAGGAVRGRRTAEFGRDSSAASEALTVAPPSPVVKARRWPLAERRGVEAEQARRRRGGRYCFARPSAAAVAPQRRVAVLAPADFCNVRRLQQSCAADDAAGARPKRRRRRAGPALPVALAERPSRRRRRA